MTREQTRKGTWRAVRVEQRGRELSPPVGMPGQGWHALRICKRGFCSRGSTELALPNRLTGSEGGANPEGSPH